jgi:hypothetical protein
MGIMDREYYNNNNKANTRNKFNNAEASRNEEKSLLVTGGITAVAAVGAVVLGTYLIKKLCD